MSIFCDIKKRLGDFTLQISFDTKEETVALMGASGCGKSMTLRCIAGIQKPDAGKIIINGVTVFDSENKINLPPQKRRVGYMFQDYALFPNMTVEKNIGAVLGKERLDELPGLLETYCLTGLEKLYPRQLSGGQKQRCALARMIAMSPEIILLDEPFAALDSFLRWQMEQEVAAAIKKAGKSVLFVSHDRDEVFRVSDRVIVMHQGKSEEITEKHQLYKHPKTYVDALLTGCKNICPATLTGDLLEAKEFGISFPYRQGELRGTGNLEVLDKREEKTAIHYIGIRSKSILPAFLVAEDTKAFRASYTIEQTIENVFTYVLMVRLPEALQPLRWEMSKDIYQTLADHEAVLAIPYESIYELVE